MKNNFILSTLIFCLSGSFTPANAQSWQWAKRAGGDQNDVATGIATDASGFTYFAGSFQSSSVIFGTDTLFNYGGCGGSDCGQLFIVKYDSSGNVVWARSASGNVGVSCITTDASGNIYITGSFGGPSATFGLQTIYNAGGRDIFVTKYNTTGDVTWARSVGGVHDDDANSIKADNYGGVYVTGDFGGMKDTIGSTVLTNTGLTSFLLIKFDTAGNLVWARNNKGDGYDAGYSVTTDLFGSVYVTGAYSGDTMIIGTTKLINAEQAGEMVNCYDIFLLKYDTAGNCLWGRNISGSGCDQAYTVATDMSGNVLIAGEFASADLNIDTIILHNCCAASAFLAKFTSSGDVIWAKEAAGTTGSNLAYSVATDTAGDVYVTGNFQSANLTFGSVAVMNDTPINNVDVFFAKYSSSGDVLMAESIAGSFAGYYEHVSTDDHGNVYLTGAFTSTEIGLGGYSLTNDSAGTSDIFLAKFSNSTLAVPDIKSPVNGLRIYPNPASRELVVGVPDAAGKIDVEIMDLLGRPILYRIFDTSEIQSGFHNFRINLPVLANGIYALKIRTEYAVKCMPFVIKQ